MTSTKDSPALILGGRGIDSEEAWNRLFRYCGIQWDDHPSETWAFRYYDDIETDRRAVVPEDVVCAGALHAGL